MLEGSTPPGWSQLKPIKNHVTDAREMMDFMSFLTTADDKNDTSLFKMQ